MGNVESTILLWVILKGIGIVLLLVLAYFLIKSAVKAGIKSANRESNSGTDFQYKQIRILAEIARNNGVSEDKIQEILYPNN